MWSNYYIRTEVKCFSVQNDLHINAGEMFIFIFNLQDTLLALMNLMQNLIVFSMIKFCSL